MSFSSDMRQPTSLHVLVPAGALAPDGRTWLAPKHRDKPFLLPVRALSMHFRGRFMARARAALPQLTFHVPWSKRWVVFAKPAVQGPQRVLQYLGRYVHRTALSDKAIIACDERIVRVAYRDSRDHQRKCMSLPAQEFLRRFLQHVPAKGLHRVRAFGLLHPSHRTTLRQLQLMLAQRRTSQRDADDHEDERPSRAPLRCPRCKTPALRLLRRLSAAECIALRSWPASPVSNRPRVLHRRRYRRQQRRSHERHRTQRPQ